MNDRLIDELSKTEENGIPSKYGFMMLFVSVENNLKASTDLSTLNNAYAKYFKENYKDFNEFLSDALNQRISFSKKHLSLGSQTSFSLDKDVEARYHSLEASEFVKYYVVEVNGKKTLNTAKYENKSLLTILYYLFISNHEITFDDYIGRYYVKEM